MNLFFFRVDSYTGPVLDSQQNVFLLNAEKTSDGNVTIEFNRLLNTPDNQRDRTLVPHTLQRFNWGFNPAPDAVRTENGSVIVKHPTPNRGIWTLFSHTHGKRNTNIENTVFGFLIFIPFLII
jgi:hypothetical protein